MNLYQEEKVFFCLFCFFFLRNYIFCHLLICLFLAALGLLCHVQAVSSCKQGLLSS